MNKKILAVMLTLVMVVSMFTGCGKKDSTYFKEVKEMCKIQTGTQTVEMNLTYKGDELGEAAQFVADAEGNAVISIKVEGTVESVTKQAAKIMAKLGTDADYTELTTIILDGKKLYVTIDPIIAFVKKIDEASATQIETALASIGVTGTVSIDYGQLLEAMGQKDFEITEDMKKSAYDLIETFMDALEKNFKDLEGEDGDDYTLTINGDNADKAVTGLANFCKNDMKGLVEKLSAFMADFYGEDSTIYASAKESCDEIANNGADIATSIEEGKVDFVKTIKDNKLNIVSKASVSGSEGKREAKLTIETGDVTVEDQMFNVNMKAEMKEGTPSISEMIPENASDLTTMLIAMMNQMSQSGVDSEGYTDSY